MAPDRARGADQEHLVLVHGGETVGFAVLAGLPNPHPSRIHLAASSCGASSSTRIGAAAVWQAGVARRGRPRLRPRAHRVRLDVKEANRRARALYASEGFICEGVLREVLREPDGWASLVEMSVLEGERLSP